MKKRIIKTRTVPINFRPFHPIILLHFQGNDTPGYRLAIYDMLGRIIKSDIVTNNSSGKSIYTWDGTDFDGNQLPSGVYFVKVQTGQLSAERKITLIR